MLPGNPSSQHRVGRRAAAALDDARLALARILGCNALDIVWTSGASEAANTVLHHFTSRSDAGRPVWVSAIEHPCVLVPARHYFGERLRIIPVGHSGIVDVEWVRNRLEAERPALVAVLAASNETGVIQPWKELAAACMEYEVPFYCDAAQWLGKLPAAGLGGCDFLGGSAHKFGGPKGVGFLKCPRQGMLEPLIRGGPQEDGRRAGTEDVAGVLAMVAALTDREKRIARGGHETRGVLRTEFEHDLRDWLPGVEIVGSEAARLWNTVSVIMPPSDCRSRHVVKLDKLGFEVSTGSACSSGSEAASHVFLAMGYTPEEAGRALRFSSGWETSGEEWRQLAEAVEKGKEGVF